MVARHWSAAALAALLTLPVGVTAVGCAKEAPQDSVVQPDDLTASSLPFDRNNVLDLATLTDYQALDGQQIQTFLRVTPYKRGSFLETYQSNGIRAADAVLRAATTYRLNPIAFLVVAQVMQGLIGEPLYPQPPWRVEYAFSCGCTSPDRCEGSLAGFDRQVDCIGRQVRADLDTMTETGVTTSGWGPGVTTKSMDGVSVTPQDEGTAALYAFAPIVGEGKGGVWLFWNIWQKYADKLDYAGAFGPAGGGGWVGDACRADSACGVPNPICAVNYPSGLCTTDCTDVDCPDSPGRVKTFCANFEGVGYCLPICDPNVEASCRPGYTCRSVQRFDRTNEAAFVCTAAE